jgi:hypothetical protein
VSAAEARADRTGARFFHDARKVVAGFVSFTEVPDGEHRSYNEWHMLDHMPEQYPIPGIVHGQRWVVSPRCAAARLVAEPPLAAAHYMTLYLLAEPLAHTLRHFVEVGRRLADAGRFHRGRRAHLSGPLRIAGQWASPRVLVTELAVPYRPNRGLFVVVERHRAPVRTEPAGAVVPALVELDGVAGIWVFSSDPTVGELAHAGGAWRVAVAYLDDDPVTVAQRAGDRLLAGLACPDGAVALAGPMETIRPWEWGWFDDVAR